MKELWQDHESRIKKLESIVVSMEQSLAWHTKIGYYIATLITTIAIKLIFFG